MKRSCLVLVIIWIVTTTVDAFHLKEYPEQASQNCNLIESAVERCENCLRKGKITNLSTFDCYDVNSEGGCGEGERLVLIEGSECAETKCVDNRDQQQKPCRNGEIAFNGKCLRIGNKIGCMEEGQGRAVTADLYGGVSCECASHLGFFEVDGECHPEYLQGGCPEGQHVRRKGTFSGICTPHKCPAG